MREAPSLMLIHYLLNYPTNLRLFDPIAMPRARALLQDCPTITWCQDELEVAKGADALVLMTEWKQFRLLDFQSILNRMTERLFLMGAININQKKWHVKASIT